MALRIYDLRYAYAVKLAEGWTSMHFISEVMGLLDRVHQKPVRQVSERGVQGCFAGPAVLQSRSGRKGSKGAVTALC